MDFVGIAVGVDNVLVDAPGDFEGDVLVAGKQVEYLGSSELSVGDRVLVGGCG